jgi:hypothetical protein
MQPPQTANIDVYNVPEEVASDATQRDLAMSPLIDSGSPAGVCPSD